MFKIINMYVSELLINNHIARFIYSNKVNTIDLEDFVKRLKEEQNKRPL